MIEDIVFITSIIVIFVDYLFRMAFNAHNTIGLARGSQVPEIALRSFYLFSSFMDPAQILYESDCLTIALSRSIFEEICISQDL